MTSKVLRVLLVLLLFAAVQLAVGQVTFSKGWGPGKRSPPDGDCKVNSKGLALVLRGFATELRRLIACDHPEANGYLRAAFEH